MGNTLVLENEIDLGAVLTQQDPKQIRDAARAYEAAGFDSIWAGDHISFHVPLIESITLLSFVAAATERVRIGTSVYLLPLRHPTITAKTTAALDVVSGGRFQFGIGVGGEFPPEFEAVGVPVNERGSRANEAIEIIRKLWTGEKVGHDGKHFSFGPVALAPKPVQEHGPPIIVGGRKPPAFRRAGRLGDGYVSHMCSPDMFRDNLETIRGHAQKAGRRDVPFKTTTFIFTILGDDYDKCHKAAADLLKMIYNVDFDEAAHKYCLLGRPEDCLQQMQRFVDAGSRGFILSPLMPPEEFLTRATTELLPAARNLKLPSP
jgi:probable F420-dependent oxidoreductase